METVVKLIQVHMKVYRIENNLMTETKASKLIKGESLELKIVLHEPNTDG